MSAAVMIRLSRDAERQPGIFECLHQVDPKMQKCER